MSYDYEELGKRIGALVTEKQKAYGDSFGRAGPIMKILYPSGISPDKLDDALVVVRILDKLSRIATHRDAFGESPFRDIAGYGILGAAHNEAKVDESKVEGQQESSERNDEIDRINREYDRRGPDQYSHG